MPAVPKSVATLVAADFRPLLDHTFTLEFAPGHVVPAVLVTVEESPALRRLGASRDPFAIVLRAPAGSPLRQGTYVLAHPELGRFELFITALQPTEASARYQAVFT